LGEIPKHNPLVFFFRGRFLKIHAEIKNGVVYVGIQKLLEF
jgi:hypothetical protein